MTTALAYEVIYFSAAHYAAPTDYAELVLDILYIGYGYGYEYPTPAERESIRSVLDSRIEQRGGIARLRAACRAAPELRVEL